MNKIILMVLALGFAVSMNAQTVADPAVATKAGEVEWLTWEEAVKRMETEPRKIMVDVYTDWCGWCKRMDATTMKDPVVAQVLGEYYYAVKMDGEYKKDIEFKGRTYKFIPKGRRGYHELPAEIMNGKMSYPTLVFLDEDYNIIQPIPGYKTKDQLEPILSYFGGDFYKDTEWANFLKEYKSPSAQ